MKGGFACQLGVLGVYCQLGVLGPSGAPSRCPQNPSPPCQLFHIHGKTGKDNPAKQNPRPSRLGWAVSQLFTLTKPSWLQKQQFARLNFTETSRPRSCYFGVCAVKRDVLGVVNTALIEIKSHFSVLQKHRSLYKDGSLKKWTKHSRISKNSTRSFYIV